MAMRLSPRILQEYSAVSHEPRRTSLPPISAARYFVPHLVYIYTALHYQSEKRNLSQTFVIYIIQTVERQRESSNMYIGNIKRDSNGLQSVCVA